MAAETKAHGRTLRLLVAPHAAAILAVLVGRSCGFAELRDQLGDPPAEALLDRLEELIEIGALRRRAGGYELSGSGRELTAYSMRLAALLRRVPGGPHEIDSPAAREIVEALLTRWPDRRDGRHPTEPARSRLRAPGPAPDGRSGSRAT